MLKRIRSWWIGQPLPIAFTDDEGEIAGLIMPREGAAHRWGRRWRRLGALRSAAAFFGSVVTAIVGVVVGHVLH